MMQSETIGKLADALAKAQAEIRGALKDSTNPHFKSSYADLASVWDACREPLTKNGLAVVQTTDGDADGSKVEIITTLAHSSGEWIRGRLIMRPVKADPQGIGSAITYARRYALAAMVGVAPEDDDGEAAQGRTRQTTERSSGNGAQGKTAAPQSNGELTEDKAIAFVGAYKAKLVACQTAHDVAALGEKNGANLEKLRRAFPEYHQGLVDLIDAKLADLRAAEEPGIAA